MSGIISLKTKITTPLLAETRDFYRELFGLQLVEEWDEPDDCGCILAITDVAGAAFLEIYRGAERRDFSGLSLQFRVADLDAFRDSIEGRFDYRGPIDRPWGSRYLYLTDPNALPVVVFSGGL